MSPGLSGTRTILIVVPHEGYLRNFFRLIDELIRRQYSIHVVLDPNRRKDAPKGSYQRCIELGVHFLEIDPRVPHRSKVGQWVNTLLGAEVHVKHSQAEDPAAIRAFRRAGPLGSTLARHLIPSRLRLDRGLRWSRSGYRNVLLQGSYEFVLVSPAVEFGSDSWEWINAARRNSIPNALLVASWDNLTNKSTLGLRPDWVFVWSDHQAAEARLRHAMQPERIKVVGSLVLSWHLAVPAGNHKSGCHVMYAGSSAFLSTNEGLHFAAWWRAVRENPELQDLKIIVRLHPNGRLTREEVESIVGYDPLTRVFGPDVPDNSGSETEFAEQLASAIALVGINTSAFIDAQIRGVPALALDSPHVRQAQSKSGHFQGLLKYGGVELAQLEPHMRRLTSLRKAWHPKPSHEATAFCSAFVFPNESKSPEEVTCDLLDELFVHPAKSRSADALYDAITYQMFLVAGILWVVNQSLVVASNQLREFRKQMRGTRKRLRRCLAESRRRVLN